MKKFSGKRTDPAKLRRDQEAIMKALDEFELKLPPDTEHPESVGRRNARYAPPRRRGAMVGSFKRRNQAEPA